MTSEKLNLELTAAPPQLGTAHRLTEVLGLWLERARQRTTLAHLDAWAVRDLGISDADRWRESTKPPWRS
jgi:uncharacterized protein YjiS (DUF1127 family)